MISTKALVLFSGGLDSLLAVKILQAQGIEVVGVCFKSSFFNEKKAVKYAKNIGIELKVTDISGKELALVKNPPSGYGKHLNPCIDCHSLMIKEASGIAKKEKYDIIATGEVLGQRPFSQNKEALEKLNKISGVEVLRPLSAKLLDETQVEKSKLVIRGRLYNISGRRREKQLELVKKYKIKDIPSPAGGCLLTDPGFSDRLIKLLDYWPDCGPGDVELLKYGRVFWLAPKGKNKKVIIIVGRHISDNENLEKLVKNGDIVLELKEVVGPITLIRTKDKKLKIGKINEADINIPDNLKMSSLNLGEKKADEEILHIASLLTGYYSTKARGKKAIVKIKSIKDLHV